MSDVTFTFDDADALEFEINGPTPTRIVMAEDRGPRGLPGEDGVDGTPGALPPSTLAARPVASSVPAGTLHYATDSSTPIAISTGSAWISPPSTSPFVTSVTDATSSLTTTIAALNTQYRIGALETADVVWPGGIARVSVVALAQADTGHVATQTDTVQIQRSTDSGATWVQCDGSFAVGWRQSPVGTAWVPEQQIVAADPSLTTGATVRFRTTFSRFFTGTVPVTVPWQNATRSLLVEALR